MLRRASFGRVLGPIPGSMTYVIIKKLDEDQKKSDQENHFSGDDVGVVALRSAAKFGDFVKGAMRSKKFWRRLFLGVAGAVILGMAGVAALLIWYSQYLPSPSRVVRHEGYASRITDRSGEVLFDLYRDAKRMPVAWEDIPDYLKEATIAVEDKDFYRHRGFDPLTPLRIMKNLLINQRLVGGSTLTQQLVKNVLLTSERTVSRKIKEFMLAVQIEAKYSKDEILLMYLNEAPYGGSAWGVGSAAEQYFGKKVKDLNLAESIILAGLPQRPNVYSPFSQTSTAYIDRSAHVVARMVEDGYLGAAVGEDVLAQIEIYKFYDNKNKLFAPHFIFWMKDQLAAKYGEDLVEMGGLKITTTLDLKLQDEVQRIVSQEIDKAEKLGVSNGAALVIEPVTGQVLAMVGSRDYYSTKTDGNFNVVTQGLRQPGSAIKPVTYLTAIKRGYTVASLVMDTPVVFPAQAGQTKDYAPKNYSGKFNGPMNIRTALGNSINTAAVKTLARVGLENMLRGAFEMGMTSLEPTKENLSRFGLAVTLGGAEVRMSELAAAYAAFANEGRRVDLVGVLKVEDRDGRVLEEFKPLAGKQVMSAQEAFIISHILADNSAREITFGAVNGLIIPNYQVAVKTGTTNDKKDNWAIGWTPNLLTAVWVGNNDNTPMLKVASGVSGATPIWRRIMLFELPRRQKQDFPIPEKIVSLEVDRISGYAAHDGFAGRQEYFIDGTQPRVDDPIHLKLKVCKGVTGLAPPQDVASNNYEEKEFFKFKEDDVVSKDGKNRWQEGIDQWIAEQPDREKYAPPEGYCRSGGLVDVAIDSPGHQSTVGSTFEVRLRTTSLKKIVEVKLWVDGAEKQTWTEKPFEMSLTLDNGPHVIKVKATDKDGNTAEREAYIGVNVPWDWKPSPTPTMTPIPTATPTLILTLSPTPTI